MIRYNMIIALTKGGVEVTALIYIGCFVMIGFFVYLAIAD
ncbi:hypothetical protein JOC94_003430 [Bacillus thermophilus]|uniref:Uncharacterized protein n=1 Tax=Siminovitchia thermophila TaxID=1245522 RepID=A0ABS2R9U2_9BACI|nr:hypothetical protein [Siminovitchia thermophila]